MLLHANGLSHTEFTTLVPLLADSCEVIAWDQPGHGSSQPRGGIESAGVDACATALSELLSACGTQRAVLAGSSYGAFIATELARREPALVNGLALIEAQWRTGQWWQERWPLVEKMFGTPPLSREQAAARLVTPLMDAVLQQWNEDRQCAGAPRMLQVMRELAGYDLGSAIAALPMPVRLIYGSRSPTVDNAPTLHAQRPDALVEVIENAGHYPAIDAAPELAQRLVEFTHRCHDQS